MSQLPSRRPPEGEGGIADALQLAEHFSESQSICVVLGDNIIETNIIKACEKFRWQGSGAHVILRKVTDPQRFGVPVFDGDRIVEIEEKPKEPKSHYAVIGIYMYDATVFDRMRWFTSLLKATSTAALLTRAVSFKPTSRA